jgi:hypothetical protein
MRTWPRKSPTHRSRRDLSSHSHHRGSSRSPPSCGHGRLADGSRLLAEASFHHTASGTCSSGEQPRCCKISFNLCSYAQQSIAILVRAGVCVQRPPHSSDSYINDCSRIQSSRPSAQAPLRQMLHPLATSLQGSTCLWSTSRDLLLLYGRDRPFIGPRLETIDIVSDAASEACIEEGYRK